MARGGLIIDDGLLFLLYPMPPPFFSFRVVFGFQFTWGAAGGLPGEQWARRVLICLMEKCVACRPPASIPSGVKKRKPPGNRSLAYFFVFVLGFLLLLFTGGATADPATRSVAQPGSRASSTASRYRKCDDRFRIPAFFSPARFSGSWAPGQV